MLSKLSPLQLAAMISFVLCKVTNLAAAGAIVASLASKELRGFAWGLVIAGVSLLVLTFVFAGFSIRQERRKEEKLESTIEQLLANEETRDLLKKRLRNVELSK